MLSLRVVSFSVQGAPVQGQVPVLPVLWGWPGGGDCAEPHPEEGVWGGATGYPDHAGPDRARCHDEDDPPQTVSVPQEWIL